MAETEEIQEIGQDEAPDRKLPWAGPVSRRDFFKVSGASLALASLSACIRKPVEKIVPYVRRPEEIVPGRPLFYATAVTLGGVATGVLVESHLGRPTKLEGNPDHPASLGATDPFSQAAVQILYDPDRSQIVLKDGQASTYDAFLTEFRRALDAQRGRQGAGLRILTETVTSPTLAAQLRAILAEFPRAKWYQYDPAGIGDNVREGARLAFGDDVNTICRFEGADVVVSFEADFLAANPMTLRGIREFSRRRKVESEHPNLNRLYVFENLPTGTGARADHRFRMRSREIELIVREVASRLGVDVGTARPQLPGNLPAKVIDALVKDLQAAAGRSVVLAGEGQPASVHAIVHAINQRLGNAGRTVVYTNPIEANPTNQIAGLVELAGDLDAGRVEVLAIVGGNPAYNAPVDLQFAARLPKAAFRAHLSLYVDETSNLCQWQVPEAHSLEAWSDARAFDGTATIVQPLIAPLYPDAKSAHEFLAAFTNQPARTGHEIVREAWRGTNPPGDFERWWDQTLNNGLVANSAFPPKQIALQANLASGIGPGPRSGQASQGYEIVFRPDPTIYDGRFANSAWLQELSKPITLLTWDNSILMSPASARELGVKNEDIVELTYQGQKVQGGVWIVPGHADKSITVHLGYGRTSAGQTGTGIGFNAYLLRTSKSPWSDEGASAAKVPGQWRLATTQEVHTLADRDIVRRGTVSEFEHDPHHFQHEHIDAEKNNLYPRYEYPGYAWGMTVNQGSCVGCNACVIACQVENNIPTVGKYQVTRSRQMHWLRIDTYYETVDDPEINFQPMYCQQCETAPCEVVCPVTATAHSSEGLNDMVYNRCVGTRYCSQNCPYKVRRFNYLEWNNYDPPAVLKLLPNPDVTVRSRGVMEKCTYCVQRINGARIEAEKGRRPIRDGEIVTACQAACPAEVFTFGDINDKSSQVSRWKQSPLNYGVLSELGTLPRTTYLAALRNPNPELESV